MKKKFAKNKDFFLIVLSILVICLSFTLLYDKFSKKSNMICSNTTINQAQNIKVIDYVNYSIDKSSIESDCVVHGIEIIKIPMINSDKQGAVELNNKLKNTFKIYIDATKRTVWDKENEKYYISVVDIIGVISESKDGRKYWNKLKQRLKEEGNETVTNCHQLKLKAGDGKYRSTDVVDIEGMFRIIESIPSKNAEPIKVWLAKLGSERINEVFDPSLAAQRSIDLYRAKGYNEKWIAKRLKGIQDRKELTDVWQENGITEGKEFAILTNEIYKEWSGMDAKQYKEYKGLRKESLRDNMDNIEIILTDLSEETAKRLAAKHKPQGL